MRKVVTGLAIALVSGVGWQTTSLAEQVRHFRGQCTYQSPGTNYREPCDVTIKTDSYHEQFWVKFLRTDILIPAERILQSRDAQVNGGNPAYYSVTMRGNNRQHKFNSLDQSIFMEVLEPLGAVNSSNSTGDDRSRTGIVPGPRGSEVYLRQRPNFNQGIVGSVRTGMQVQVLRSQKDNQGTQWYLIRTDHLRGWISGNLIFP